MSSVGGVGGTAAERLRLFLTPSVESTASVRSATSASTTTSSGTVSESTTAETNETGLASLWQQIEEAIEAALRSLDSSTASAAEVMDSIKGAVDRTLKANGIDPGARPEPPPGGAPPSGPPPAGMAGGTEPPPGGPPMGPPPGGGSGDDLSSLIDRLLEESGFDADAIRNELQAAWSTGVDGVQAGSAGSQGGALAVLALFPLSEGVDAQV